MFKGEACDGSFLHLPSKTRIAEDSRDVWVDNVVIDSCTNGRTEDMRVAAEVHKGRKVLENVRLIISATQQIDRQRMREGLTDIILDAQRGGLGAEHRGVGGPRVDTQVPAG